MGYSTPEQRATARRDAAFMESYRLRQLALESDDPEEIKRLLREAEAQERIAYSD